MTAASAIDGAKAALASEDPGARAGAAMRLGALGTPEVIPLLVQMLADPDRGVAEAAASALTTLGTSQVAEALLPLLGSEDLAERNLALSVLKALGPQASPVIRLLRSSDADLQLFALEVILDAPVPVRREDLAPVLHHENANVRAAALRVAANALGDEAVPDLAAGLGGHSWVAMAAAEGLSRIGSPAAVRALTAVPPDSPPMLLFGVVKALGESGRPEALPFLRQLAESGPAHLRQMAEAAAAEIEARAEVEVAVLPQHVAALVDSLSDPDPAVARRARARLASADLPGLDERLWERLLEAPPEIVPALRTLLLSRGKLPVDTCLAALDRMALPLPVREAAVQIAAPRIAAEQVDVLIAHLRRGDPGLRPVLVRALGRHATPEVRAVLRAAAERGDEKTQLTAMAVLHPESDPEDLSVVVGLLARATPRVSRAAAARLAGLRDRPEVADAIRTALRTDPPVALPTLLGVLGELFDPEDLEQTVARMLADGDAGHRVRGAEALEPLLRQGRIAPARLSGHIEGLLAAESAEVRRAGVRLAAAGRSPRAAEWLAGRLADDPSEAVRYEAALRLGELPGEGAAAALRRAERDPSLRVRAAVSESLARLAGRPAEPLDPPAGAALSADDRRDLVQRICRPLGMRADRETEARMLDWVERRLELLGLRRGVDYRRLLDAEGPEGPETRLLIDVATVNETYFFRNYRQLAHFAEEAVPLLCQDRLEAGDRRLRVLSAGCSTGDEVYTLAIILLEMVDRPDLWDIQVVGFDVNERVLAVARAGRYGARAVKDVPVSYRLRYLNARDSEWEVTETLRQRTRFEQGNLLDADYMAQHRDFDAVFCRNVLIYLDEDARRRAVTSLYHALRPGGVLLLGHAESVVRYSGAFRPVRVGGGVLYRKQPGRARPPSAVYAPGGPLAGLGGGHRPGTGVGPAAATARISGDRS